MISRDFGAAVGGDRALLGEPASLLAWASFLGATVSVAVSAVANTAVDMALSDAPSRQSLVLASGALTLTRPRVHR